MSALFLGVDQGTYTSRAFLFDEQGRQVAGAQEPVALYRLVGGRVEQDANQLITSTKNVINQVLNEYGKTNNVLACGIATQRSTVLNWYSDGSVNGPALSWQDVRGAQQVEALRQHEPVIKRLSGLPLSAHYGASKLRWLFDNLPVHISSKKQNYLSPLVSFLLFHLIKGKPYRVDHSNAQRTQLMELETLNWSEQLINFFGVPENMLPTCVPMCANHGVLAEYDIPVTAVCGDQNAAMHGVGDMLKTTALVNFGSGAFVLRTLSTNQTSATQLTGIAFSDNKTVDYIREATVNGAGTALSWLEKKYDIEQTQERLPTWLDTVENPPLFINSVGGLGSPWWRQDIEPEFIDAALNEVGALAVAVIESIIFMVRANLDLMIKESPLEKLRVSGGLSRLDGLCQKLSDLCNLPVERVDNPEATAKGVAWLAAGRPDNWRQTELSETFVPIKNKPLNARYARYMQALNERLEMGK